MIRNRDRGNYDDNIVTSDISESYETHDSAGDLEVVDDRRRWYKLDVVGRVNGILFTVLLALEGLLALRFTLVAFGANRSSGFVDFILDISWPFVWPFDGAFANRTWDEGVIEVSTLLAMGVWLLFFTIVALLIAATVPRLGRDYGGHDSTTVRRRRVTHSGSH